MYFLALKKKSRFKNCVIFCGAKKIRGAIGEQTYEVTYGLWSDQICRCAVIAKKWIGVHDDSFVAKENN